MIARDWRCLCPTRHREAFLDHLKRTGVREARQTPGYLGHQIVERLANSRHAGRSGAVEIGLVTFWANWDAVRAFAGDIPDAALLYPGDERFDIVPDKHVAHFEVLESELKETQAGA